MSSRDSKIPGVVWDKSRNRWRVYTGTGADRKFVATTASLEEAETISKNAAEGLLPSEESKSAAMYDKMARIRMRAVWRDVTDSQPHEWLSFDHFLSTVGDRPEHERKLEAKNPAQLIGPNNFQWVRPEFDHKTKEGRSAYLKAHRAANPRIYKDKQLRKDFGITIDEYEEKWKEQNGVCHICCEPEKGTRNGKVRWLNVDHNHTTGQVRGLLCTNCNVAVGMLYEKREIIHKVLSYLDHWDAVESTPKSHQSQPIE